MLSVECEREWEWECKCVHVIYIKRLGFGDSWSALGGSWVRASVGGSWVREWVRGFVGS